MQTNAQLKLCETRSISIAAAPTQVLEFVGDARNIPRWAPGFASAIRRDGARWILTGAGGEFAIALVANLEAGTVDVLRDVDPTSGAFARVIPNGCGSEMLFTLLFPPDATPSAVTAQMATVDAELETVRRLVEHGDAR